MVLSALTTSALLISRLQRHRSSETLVCLILAGELQPKHLIGSFDVPEPLKRAYVTASLKEK
ncbi:hypothetical protein GQX74_005758 [Glossina fuscipes]|nr:hypothetical protein GQX74_005758 [Glossina fuscipes]